MRRPTTLPFLFTLAVLACDPSEPTGPAPHAASARSTVVTPAGTVTVLETALPTIYPGTPGPGVSLGEAKAVNAKGEAAGWALVGAFVHRAVVWSDGGVTELGTLGGPSSEALGINNAGIVVGNADTGDGEVHPFLWDGRLHDLGTLPGYPRCSATAISDSGLVVGTCSGVDAARPGRAFVWKKSANGGAVQMVTHPPLPAIVFVYGVEPAGTLAGAVVAPGASSTPTLWTGGVASALPIPDGFASGGLHDVNAKGEAVGYAALALAPPGQATLWTRKGGPVALAPVGTAWAINDGGDVVGDTFVAAVGTTAFFWSEATGRIGLGNGVWAYDINNDGVASGTTYDGTHFRPALWTVTLTP